MVTRRSRDVSGCLQSASAVGTVRGGGYSGLRRGELLALAWDDVDLDGGILRVRRTV